MKYDAIIIGSGQGGNPLAHRLADLGWFDFARPKDFGPIAIPTFGE